MENSCDSDRIVAYFAEKEKKVLKRSYARHQMIRFGSSIKQKFFVYPAVYSWKKGPKTGKGVRLYVVGI